MGIASIHEEVESSCMEIYHTDHYSECTPQPQISVSLPNAGMRVHCYMQSVPMHYMLPSHCDYVDVRL